MMRNLVQAVMEESGLREINQSVMEAVSQIDQGQTFVTMLRQQNLPLNQGNDVNPSFIPRMAAIGCT